MSFDVAADAYDRFMGRYSTPLAPELADFADIGDEEAVLDVGSGPGALTGELVRRLDRHVAAFAKALEFDLRRDKLKLDSIWINVLPPGGVHGAHIHPHSVVSGTCYVAVPAGASAIKFEDPRLGFMMAAPPKKPKAPQPGTVLLWESWLRHEVPLNEAEDDRISVSFNYRWR